ncbi:type II secretion system F family protein [Corynebacterium choanae]|uniref:type II secretion system F family protein n=1 Tax=Corynebacterium choanae TaxID=1862358 RepID=UPI0013DDA78B|nr:type II secretion system F family protein [Corynebacterium choanae]
MAAALSLLLGEHAPTRRIPGQTGAATPTRAPALSVKIIATFIASWVLLRVALHSWILCGSVCLVIAAVTWVGWRTITARAVIERNECSAQMLSAVAYQLRAGVPMHVALGRVADSHRINNRHSSPIAAVFRQAARATALGREGYLELIQAGDRLPYVTVAGALWQVAALHGIGAAELFVQAAHSAAADVRHARNTAAQLTGPRTSAAVLAALPIAGIGLGSVIGAKPLAFLIHDPTGKLLAVVGCVLLSGGLLCADWIIGRAMHTPGLSRQPLHQTPASSREG